MRDQFNPFAAPHWSIDVSSSSEDGFPSNEASDNTSQHLGLRREIVTECHHGPAGRRQANGCGSAVEQS